MANQSHKPELGLDAQAALAEGPLWDAKSQRLYWVDILGKTLHRFDPATGRDEAFVLGQYVGCAVTRKKGGLMLGLEHCFACWNDQTYKLQFLERLEAERHNNRFNDGKCDPNGRFWAGTMDFDAQPRKGSLYCLDPNHSVTKVLRNVSIPNGITWSQDGRTMFFIDSAYPIVWAFDYEPATSHLAGRRPVIRIPSREGVPDGMTIDAEGMLWVALWGGGCVTQWNPRNGKLLRKILLPVSLVSSCAFGGPQLKVLYITSARATLKPLDLRRQPLAGGLFRVEIGVPGTPAYEFDG